GLSVDALGDQRAEFGDRIARRASSGTRVLVGLSRLELEAQALQTAETRRSGRARAGDPDRVGDDNRVGREVAGVLADRGLEVRAADLFLELPEKPDVDGRAVVARVLRAEERGNRRALVVGRSPAEVPVAVPREREGSRLPVRALGRLHVEVVV